MHRWWTGLATTQDASFVGDRCCGAGWEAVIDDVPSEISPSFDWGVFLLARHPATAQRALESIWVALHVTTSGPMMLYDTPEIFGVSPGAVNLTGDERRTGTIDMRADHWGLQTTNIPFACCIAACCSRNRDTAYALHLLGVSQSLAGVHFMDLNPSHWAHGRAVSKYERDHVRLAYAVVSAYAAIEQLGLEIRASNRRPSFIDGEWNPAVKENLEERLEAAGVNLNETALWTMRGSARRVDQQRPPRALQEAPWARGQIKDVEVDIVDAIADASWLRSKAASHKLGEVAESLTLYDVTNMHYLAHRLLLERIGLWRVYELD